jgi:hypothetical protein
LRCQARHLNVNAGVKSDDGETIAIMSYSIPNLVKVIEAQAGKGGLQYLERIVAVAPMTST